MLATIRYMPPYFSNITGQNELAEVIVEITRGDFSQIWRKHVYLVVEDDIRASLGKALEELGRNIARHHGFPLVQVMADGTVRTEER